MLKKLNLLGFAAVECRPYKLTAAKLFNYRDEMKRTYDKAEIQEDG